MWTECTECIFFEDCDKRENVDGCYFGETEEELEKPKRGRRRELLLYNEAFEKAPEISLYEIVNSYKTIYSLMYSPYRAHLDKPLEEEIIEINTSELQWTEDKQIFFYVWGWPGPDYNKYTSDTYGKGWALTKEEIIKAWEEK